MEKAPLHPCEQVGVAKRICSHLFVCCRLQGYRSLAAYASMISETLLSLSCHQCLYGYLNCTTVRLFAGLRTPSFTRVHPHQAEAGELRLCFPLAVLIRLSAVWWALTRETASECSSLTSACSWRAWPYGFCAAAWSRRGHRRTWLITTRTLRPKNKWVLSVVPNTSQLSVLLLFFLACTRVDGFLRAAALSFEGLNLKLSTLKRLAVISLKGGRGEA